MTEKFIIGQLGSPFGLNGFVKIRSMSGEIDHILKLNEAAVLKNGKERILKIEEVKASPLAMRFSGIDTPEKAKTLSGGQLLGGRDQAVPLKKGEYYIEDLKGLPVVTQEGRSIGHIVDIIEGGGGELVEIQISEQLKNRKQGQSLRLVPFRKEFFSEINPGKNKIVLANLWILE